MLILIGAETPKSFGQGITLNNEVNSLIQRVDSITQVRLQQEVQRFLAGSGASVLISDPDYYRSLKDYSERISKKLFECYKECPGSQYNRRVLGLLELPQYMVDSLLNYPYTELEVRAGLGDTSAQNEIFRLYREFLSIDIKTSDDINERLYKKRLPEALLNYIGTEESVQIYLEGMNSYDVYEDQYTLGQNKNKISVFYDILSSYSGLTGQTFLTSYLYFQRFLYVEKEDALGLEYQKYLRQLEHYFDSKYGINLNIRAPYLILGSKYYIEH